MAMKIMIIMMIMIMIIIILLNNVKLLLSFYCNIEVRDLERHDTRQITSSLLNSEDCNFFPLLPTQQCRNTDCHRHHPCDTDNNQGKGGECSTVIQNCLKYLVIGITEGLLYYSGIKCNWKLILDGCVCFMAYRVKSKCYAVCVSGCVCVSDWFREEDIKS
jgi:hypothetical protein